VKAQPRPQPSPRPQQPSTVRSQHSQTSATRAPDVTRVAQLEGYFGATGTGKSTSVKRRLAQLGARVPLIVFDPKHEYGASTDRFDERTFLECVNGMADAHSPVRWAVLRPPFDDAVRLRMFDRFCKVGLAIARAKGGCIIVVDELHLVTDSARGRVPAGWLELVNTGRAYGAHVIAATIRPQSIDMDFRSNLTFIRSGRLGEKADCERVASKLMLDWRQLAQLPNLEYYERDMLAGSAAVHGRITF
jgi:hypothetical protein